MASRVPSVSWRELLPRFSWRVTLVQFLANSIVIGLLIAVLPAFELHASHRFLAVLWLAVVFGVLSALVRPLLEFLFLPYVLQSLGLVVIAINAILLALLGLTSVLQIKGVIWLLAGAAIAGVIGFFLDSVLGLTPPVTDDRTTTASGTEPAVGLASVSERLRVMQLYGILSQYGVDFAFDWAWLRPFRRRMQAWLWQRSIPAKPLPPQVKARLLLEDLGPTYVKLGQIVSSQSRVLPLAWEEELAKLQSEVRPFSYDEASGVIKESLGAAPETLYATFAPKPLAAASLGQVHEATTHAGRRVAVKVQRPNIHEQLRSDITILARAASVLERRAEWAADADLTGVVHEFGSTLMRELDYTIEAYNTRRLQRVLAPIDGVNVPDVEQTLSSDRVLTLEFIDGVKSTDAAAIDDAGVDRETLTRDFVRGAVQMLMIDGFFHADPHPGNIIVELSGGRLTFLDAGMVGELDLRQRISLARFLLAFRDGDVSTLASTLRSLSTPFREPDPDGYRRAFTQRLGPLIDSPTAEVGQLQKLFSEALDVLREAGYRLDPKLTLALKAVAQAQEITATLTPEADASAFAKLGGAALEELAPQAMTVDAVLGGARKQVIRTAGEMIDYIPIARVAVARWLTQLERGEIPVSVRHPDLDDRGSPLSVIPRLLALAVVLTGIIVGSALAASIKPSNSSFRGDLANAALILYVIGSALALLLAFALGWRLIRPADNRRKRANR